VTPTVPVPVLTHPPSSIDVLLVLPLDLLLCGHTLGGSILFFLDAAPTEIYPLSLHDALPISPGASRYLAGENGRKTNANARARLDRKSTRLNSSHGSTSYAVFCLKKKTTKTCIALSHHPDIIALLGGRRIDLLLYGTQSGGQH